MGKPQLGAHVQKEDATENDWFIIPLCVKHSMRAESLEIVDTTILVSAHVSETCARQMPIGNVWPHELRAAIAMNASKSETHIARHQDWRGPAHPPETAGAGLKMR